MDNRKTCAGCSHYRHLYSAPNCADRICHFCYDTGVSKGCRAPECTHNDHQFTVAGKPKQRRAT